MSRESTEDEVFTFALRAGDVLVRNGAPSANVTSILLAIARVHGFKNASANVTMGQISVGHVPADASKALTLTHNVGATTFNLEAITNTEQVIKDVVLGALTPHQGLKRLDAIEAADLGHSKLVRLLGWGLMSAGFAWMLGGSLLVGLFAALTAMLVELLGAWLNAAEMPGFFSQLAAGLLAVLAALGVQVVSPDQTPALVVTAALVSRLAGGAALGAAQDLLTGWYITAAGRVLEVVLNTAGQVAGVLFGVRLAQSAGFQLNIESNPAVSQNLFQSTCAAALVSCGFAIASQVIWRRLPAVVAMSIGTYLLFELMTQLGQTKAMSAALTAATLGAVTVFIATLVRVPSTGALGVVLAPLLPGVLVYHGFVSVATHNAGSSHEFFEASLVALATGAGAVLGQYLASRALWHVRRLRQRRIKAKYGSEYRLDQRKLAAQWLTAPIFRRPFMSERLSDLE